jgi:hypothetical protein
MTTERPEFCYLCGVELCRHSLCPGEKPPPNHRTRDHVPPTGLFADPKPDNLITVPCCLTCNSLHSDFDERLRMAASTPFDRNRTGQTILDNKVVGGTLAKGRQMKFAGEILASMQPVEGHPGLIRVRINAHEFHQGMVRITKGLLFALHPGFNYRRSEFDVIDIHPQPFDEQLKLMAMLKQAPYFERGQKAFQCWRHVDESKGGGAWMLIFYECFGFFVIHTNRSVLSQFKS